MIKKVCPECQSQFVGRTDKKYCSDYCRNSFNNKINSDVLKEVRKTNRMLKTNRDILFNYLEKGVSKVSLFTLVADGFSLNHVTSVHKNNRGEEVFFCYDLAYEFTDSEILKLTTKLQYEKSLVQELS